jgi:hypothetical protein
MWVIVGIDETIRWMPSTSSAGALAPERSAEIGRQPVGPRPVEGLSHGVVAARVIGRGQRDVFPQRGRVAHVVLEQGRHRRPLLRRIDAAHRDPPRFRLVEPGQQLDEGGLADAVLADHRDRLARPQRHAQPVEHRPPAARIAEHHVVELDHRRAGARSGRGPFDRPSVVGRQLVGRREAAQTVLDVETLHAHRADREQAGAGQHKRDQPAGGQVAVQHRGGRQPEHERDRDPGDHEDPPLLADRHEQAPPHRRICPRDRRPEPPGEPVAEPEQPHVLGRAIDGLFRDVVLVPLAGRVGVELVDHGEELPSHDRPHHQRGHQQPGRERHREGGQQQGRRDRTDHAEHQLELAGRGGAGRTVAGQAHPGVDRARGPVLEVGALQHLQAAQPGRQPADAGPQVAVDPLDHQAAHRGDQQPGRLIGQEQAGHQHGGAKSVARVVGLEKHGHETAHRQCEGHRKGSPEQLQGHEQRREPGTAPPEQAQQAYARSDHRHPRRRLRSILVILAV